MSNSIIRNYFESKLSQFANSKNIAVAYENVPFDKPAKNWIECSLVPVVIANPNLRAERKTYRGMFQINIYTKESKGMKELETLANDISNLFPVVPKGIVSVEKHPQIMSAIQDGMWRCVPIRIEYRYESSN